jgi:hypothetical protein
MGTFVPGLELCRRYYEELVRPILDREFPGLAHSAALLGRGSEVLGFDDEMSTDHDWKARVLLFLGEEHLLQVGASVADCLRRDLPMLYEDRPTGYEIHSLHAYFLERLSLDLARPIDAHDWLTFPEQSLRMYTSGEVYHDDVGLQGVRDRIAYYPRDIWLYLLMTGWWRVHPEANLVGRTGSVGDEVGSALIGSRLVADLMRLCFLMERQYAPYAKWFGTAFHRLACGPELSSDLGRVLRATTWQERESALASAYERLVSVHNRLQLTEPVTTEPVQLWGRPFTIPWADIPGLLREQIQDPAVIDLAERWPTGPVDHLRDLLWPARDRSPLTRLFEP